MLADPDGVPLYVMRGAVEGLSTVFRVADARHVRWNEIAAKDDGQALEFYKARFGWEAVGSMPMGEMGEMGNYSSSTRAVATTTLPRRPWPPASSSSRSTAEQATTQSSAARAPT